MNNYIICFWDKSKIQIEESLAIKLIAAIEAESIKTFSIDGNMYAVGGVEKIIKKEDAYQIFPEDYEILQRMESKQPKFQGLNADNNQKQLN